MAESMTEEERLEELTREHDESLKRHFKPAPSIVPGCSMIELLDDVKITAAASTLHAGMYVLPRDLDIKGSAKYVREHKGAHVYLFTLELNELNVNLTPVEGGKTKPDVSGSTKIIPIRLSGREEPVSLSEAAVWAAINDADRAGDHDKAQRLFRTLYGIPEQPIENNPATFKQDTNKPISHMQGISRVSEQIENVDTNGQTFGIRMSGKNESREVITQLSLNYEDGGVSLSKHMTKYDRSVHDAVATLWVAGNRAVTARQVYQAMTGSDSKPKQSAIDKVEESLDKQRRTFVKLDYSQELRGKTAEFDGETITAASAYIETYMLNADKQVITTSNGRSVSGYVFKDAPVLYKHDCTTKQIISYPQALLEATAKVASNTETNMLIRNYLIKRIKTMSRNGNGYLSKHIKYETIYKAAGNETDSRTQRNRMNETVRKYLDALRDVGMISGWSEYKDAGRSHKIIGVKIAIKKGRR